MYDPFYFLMFMYVFSIKIMNIDKMADSNDLKMADSVKSEAGEITCKEELTLLIEQQQPWTKKDKLLLVFCILMNMGDGVEMYLPGL